MGCIARPRCQQLKGALCRWNAAYSVGMPQFRGDLHFVPTNQWRWEWKAQQYLTIQIHLSWTFEKHWKGGVSINFYDYGCYILQNIFTYLYDYSWDSLAYIVASKVIMQFQLQPHERTTWNKGLVGDILRMSQNRRLWFAWKMIACVSRMVFSDKCLVQDEAAWSRSLVALSLPNQCIDITCDILEYGMQILRNHLTHI